MCRQNRIAQAVMAADVPDVEGLAMPEPDEILFATQRDGSKLKAAEIYETAWRWFEERNVAAYVSPAALEQWEMCRARWLQCEQMNNEMGFLSKHPTTGRAQTSPFINIGINYLNQATRQWDAIMQVIKENCTVDYGGMNPNDDLDMMLRERKGIK